MEPTTTETTTMQVIDEQPQPLYGRELADARRAEREAKRIAKLEAKQSSSEE